MRRAPGVGCWVLGLVPTLSLASPAPVTQDPAPGLTEQSSGTTALLQAVSAVSDRVVWVSGHRATWARSTDGGHSWTAGAMTGADSVLQFRDVHALSADTAWLLAAGPGERSRIYHTTDGGRQWRLQFQNRDSSAFFDCLDFWDGRRGIAVSDAVNGRLVIVTTDDGGASWVRVADDGIPPALPGEGAFAASGSCLVTRPGGRAWIGTGAEAGARVYASEDYGRTWRVEATPVVHGQASGIAALVFGGDRNGYALGGRIGDPRDTSVAAAVTDDGGRTWSPVPRPLPSGPIFGATLMRGRREVLVAAGPTGLAYLDLPCPAGPCAWRALSSDAYWAVGASGSVGWAVGPGGRITRLDIPPGC